MRVAPPAVGTREAIEPETSMTASMRAGRVTEIQVVSAWPAPAVEPRSGLAGAPAARGT